MRTDKPTENKQTENSKPEATLIPVDSRGERANKHEKDFIENFVGFEQNILSKIKLLKNH